MVKYSIILPVRNGLETLSETLPFMLERIKRDDVEIIISDNFSKDSLDVLISQLNDKRLKYFKTQKNYFWGKILNLDIQRLMVNG